MKGPETFETDRLILRKPASADAEALFAGYASDPEVTRFLSWRRHRSIEDTRAFLAFSETEWETWPIGPYLIENRAERRLIGGTGLSFKTPAVAETGYVLARDAWGFGYATEALGAVTMLAAKTGVRQLFAFCHPDHLRSARVLEKCGFLRQWLRDRVAEFPNLDQSRTMDCLSYSLEFGPNKAEECK